MNAQVPERPEPPDAPRVGALRGALLWASPLLLSVVVLSWVLLPSPPAPPARPAACAASPAVVHHTQLAARAANTGSLSVARSEAEAALTEAPCHAPALLILACVALEEGKTREAAESLARLKALRPERPEPKLLERMLAERQRADSGWRQAFLVAWTEQGRPNLRDSPLLPEMDAGEDPTVSLWPRASSTSSRLYLALVASPPTEEQARWLMEQVPTLEDTGLFVAVEYVLHDESLSATLRREAAPVLHRQCTRLSEAHPRSMQLRLLCFLGDSNSDAVFSSEELTALEAASSLPEWKESAVLRTFLKARRQLEAAGFPNPSDGAYTVASLSVTDRGSALLQRRSEATRSGLLSGARQRLGSILFNVGARKASESSLVERMTGLQLMRDGAKDVQGDAESARVSSRVDEAYALLSAEHGAALERWPLPSLQAEVLEASARDEWAHLRDFLGPPAPPSKQAGAPSAPTQASGF